MRTPPPGDCFERWPFLVSVMCASSAAAEQAAKPTTAVMPHVCSSRFYVDGFRGFDQLQFRGGLSFFDGRFRRFDGFFRDDLFTDDVFFSIDDGLGSAIAGFFTAARGFGW